MSDELNNQENAQIHEDELEQSSLPLTEGLRLDAKIEAVIFASQKPLKTLEIFDLVKNPEVIDVEGEEPSPFDDSDALAVSPAPEVTLKDVQECLNQLLEYYRDRAGGFTLRYTKGLGYQFQTVPAGGIGPGAPICPAAPSNQPRGPGDFGNHCVPPDRLPGLKLNTSGVLMRAAS
jgi:hypothetical protein